MFIIIGKMKLSHFIVCQTATSSPVQYMPPHRFYSTWCTQSSGRFRACGLIVTSWNTDPMTPKTHRLHSGWSRCMPFLSRRFLGRSLLKMSCSNPLMRLEQRAAEADQIIEHLKQQVQLLKEKASKMPTSTLTHAYEPLKEVCLSRQCILWIILVLNVFSGQKLTVRMLNTA